MKLGVFFMTAGITALAFKSAASALFGLVMIMFGFRLIAKGLDRLDKNIFIDKYKDDE